MDRLIKYKAKDAEKLNEENESFLKYVLLMKCLEICLILVMVYAFRSDHNQTTNNSGSDRIEPFACSMYFELFFIFIMNQSSPFFRHFHNKKNRFQTIGLIHTRLNKK